MLSFPSSTMLIIDADPAVQALVADILAADGHRPVAATTLADALTALSAFRFDLILADAPVLPGPDRWAALDRLRAASAAPVVILTTAGAIPFAGYRARGFAGLVTKPFDGDDLSTTLRGILAAARAPESVAA
jgi:CheY-like chemotaxis protein